MTRACNTCLVLLLFRNSHNCVCCHFVPSSVYQWCHSWTRPACVAEVSKFHMYMSWATPSPLFTGTRAHQHDCPPRSSDLKQRKCFCMNIGRTVQFSSRWYLCAWKSPYALYPSLRSFPNVAFEMVPMFVWLTMALSRPFKEDRLELRKNNQVNPTCKLFLPIFYVFRPTGVFG